MQLIFHITQHDQWEHAAQTGTYRGDTLASEGFIHCSTAHQVVKVADTRFRRQKGLVLLCIDAAALQSPLRYEPGETGELFPHIYGPLNVDAVVKALAFEPAEDGTFTLPRELRRET